MSKPQKLRLRVYRQYIDTAAGGRCGVQWIDAHDHSMVSWYAPGRGQTYVDRVLLRTTEAVRVWYSLPGWDGPANRLPSYLVDLELFTYDEEG